jgi:hypothetical protein
MIENDGRGSYPVVTSPCLKRCWAEWLKWDSFWHLQMPNVAQHCRFRLYSLQHKVTMQYDEMFGCQSNVESYCSVCRIVDRQFARVSFSMFNRSLKRSTTSIRSLLNKRPISRSVSIQSPILVEKSGTWFGGFFPLLAGVYRDLCSSIIVFDFVFSVFPLHRTRSHQWSIVEQEQRLYLLWARPFLTKRIVVSRSK